jgi:hypothetical protein
LPEHLAELVQSLTQLPVFNHPLLILHLRKKLIQR